METLWGSATYVEGTQGTQTETKQGDSVMATAYLLKYEQGSSSALNIGKIVVGSTFPVTSAAGMYAVAADWSGNLFIADITTNAIYKVTESGQIGLFAGKPNNDGFVNGVGTAARFNQPKGIACDKSGNVYVADTGNNRIRKIDMNGKVTTIAGGFSSPADVAVAPNGDIIVADTGNHKIYRVKTGGQTLLVAGSTIGNVAGDTGGTKIKGSAAKFSSPNSVTVDNTGNIYVSDSGNYQIKVIHPDGWVKVFAGTGTSGNVNGKAAVAQFSSLLRVKADRSGNLFVIDAKTTYNRIKLIDQNGNVSTFANNAKNENCWGLAVTPADKVFAVVGAGTAGYESSSSSSSILEHSSHSSQSSLSSEKSSQSSVSTASSINSSSSSSSKSSPSSLSSEKSSQSSASSASSRSSEKSSQSSQSSSSQSPGSRP